MGRRRRRTWYTRPPHATCATIFPSRAAFTRVRTTQPSASPQTSSSLRSCHRNGRTRADVRIDRTHRNWIIVVAALTVVATLIYVFALSRHVSGAFGGTWAGLLF